LGGRELETAGASNVNTPSKQPTALRTVTDAAWSAPEPSPLVHEKDVADVHAVDAHVFALIAAVGELSVPAKLSPVMVK